MKNKITDILTCVLFCAFLFCVFALFLFLPEGDYSEKEKRYLAEKPKLTWENVSSGGFSEDVETYLADHMPGRDFFVGLNAYIDLLANRQVTKDIYLAGNDRLVEAPIVWDEAVAQRNMDAVNKFAEAVGRPIDFMLVPSAGCVLQDTVMGLQDPYTDERMIASIYDMAGGNLICRDLLPAFTSAEDAGKLYYRTDHHWTSLGAYTAYSTYMDMLGRQYPAQSEFTVQRHMGFLGSTYSRSGLWMIPAEPVELWENDTAFTVTNSETGQPHDGLFYTERLQELDKYTVYLDGNHSLVTIQNPDAAGKGKLLVIRDSYANCLGTFLANSYESVTLVDLRYYKKPVSELLASEDFTDVLVCYSLSNFMTDTNFVWLR